MLLTGIKAVRSAAARPALARLIVKETRPGDSVNTDDEIRAYIRETTQTTWHIVGACKMGTDADAVVDPPASRARRRWLARHRLLGVPDHSVVEHQRGRRSRSASAAPRSCSTPGATNAPRRRKKHIAQLEGPLKSH